MEQSIDNFLDVEGVDVMLASDARYLKGPLMLRTRTTQAHRSEDRETGAGDNKKNNSNPEVTHTI